MMQGDGMRVTVDIDEESLADLAALTGEKKISPAVAKAVADWVKRQKAKQFGTMIMEGQFDYGATAEETSVTDA
jgi:S-adenosylmethionine:diacylglycerol 3-amino-3-carboxypropyl transferase